jgi:hypothetical protein
MKNKIEAIQPERKSPDLSDRLRSFKYKLNPSAGTNGTHLIGYIETRYESLIKAFGNPLGSDGHKISGEWFFTDEDGGVFTIYDWKATDLYDKNLPSVDQFREYPAYEFNIGGHSQKNVEEFKAWVKEQTDNL